MGIFLIMALWEIKQPMRVLRISKTQRWLNNLGMVVLNSVVLRLLFPTAAVGMALLAQQQGWGLFNYFSVPHAIALVASLLLLDLVIYLQHVMMHAVPLLWRLHQVHHVDLDFDVTTGFRFHPIEIIVSMLIKFAAIILIGPSVAAVILFEVILNGTSMFNHGNVRLPKSVDRLLRWLVVTPDMHRVHHSTLPKETHSNFGFNLPWWDRLFGTYRAQPQAGHHNMAIGVAAFTNPNITQSLPALMLLPFKGDKQTRD